MSTLTRTFDVTGMHCGACVAKVSTALRAVPGVTAADVTLHPPQARIEMTQDIATRDLDQAAGGAGAYGVRAREDDANASPSPAPSPSKSSIFPLVLIVAYLATTVVIIAVATNAWSPHTLMRHFMAGFFLVFSFFKLLDVRGFADAYRSYDVLARVWPVWGLVYPVVELALGVAYLLDRAPIITNIATLVIMLLGAVGVFKALLDKRNKPAMRCACLGTVLNLPMTTVTLVEDVGMAAMAAAMLTLTA